VAAIAAADLLGYANLDLLGLIDSLACQLADETVVPEQGAVARLAEARREFAGREAFVRAGGDPADAIARAVFVVQWLAANAELRRRRALHARLPGDTPDPDDARLRPYRDLAAEVRRRADLLALFAEAGIRLRRSGRSTRSGEEWAGACPRCGGGPEADRCRVWPEAGRWWCRRCNAGANDAAALVMLTVPGRETFPAALRHLADRLGLAWPDERRLFAGGAR